MEIWTEKYRPDRLDKVINQSHVLDKLKGFVAVRNIPHLLFAGPAGTGKTTCALAIARELFGDVWRSNLLELNASDERGIDTIRTKVKDFARTRPLGNFQFKVILLDEADALTKDAQQALRRTMESYSKTCRFILDCNFSSKIISPIQSRCAVFRFRPLNKEDIFGYVSMIAEAEKIKGKGDWKSALEVIADVSNGDARRAVNLLQSCASIGDFSDKTVYEIAGMAKPDEMKEVLNMSFSGQIRKSMDMLMDIMFKYGLSGSDVIREIQRIVVGLEISPEVKIRMIDKIAEYEYRMIEGADEMLQLEALIAQFALFGK